MKAFFTASYVWYLQLAILAFVFRFFVVEPKWKTGNFMSMTWAGTAEAVLMPLFFFGTILAFAIFICLSFFYAANWDQGLLLMLSSFLILMCLQGLSLPISSYPLILVNYLALLGFTLAAYLALLK